MTIDVTRDHVGRLRAQEVAEQGSAS